MPSPRPNPASTLQNALMPLDGPPVEVTKIEIEVLDSGKCRWTLFGGSGSDRPRRLYTAVADPGAIPVMLESTQAILEGMSALKRLRLDQ
jgi:hypothetical protein